MDQQCCVWAMAFNTYDDCCVLWLLYHYISWRKKGVGWRVWLTAENSQRRRRTRVPGGPLHIFNTWQWNVKKTDHGWSQRKILKANSISLRHLQAGLSWAWAFNTYDYLTGFDDIIAHGDGRELPVRAYRQEFTEKLARSRPGRSFSPFQHLTLKWPQTRLRKSHRKKLKLKFNKVKILTSRTEVFNTPKDHTVVEIIIALAGGPQSCVEIICLDIIL